ncbi:UNVERIFIED_CONTAM: hypothetical protein K2H54_060672 [Gekko kuhli]
MCPPTQQGSVHKQVRFVGLKRKGNPRTEVVKVFPPSKGPSHLSGHRNLLTWYQIGVQRPVIGHRDPWEPGPFGYDHQTPPYASGACFDRTPDKAVEVGTESGSAGDRRPEVGSPAPKARHREMRIGPDGKSPVTVTVRCGDAVPMVIGADMAPTALIPGVENDLSTSKPSRRRLRVGSKWKVNDAAGSTPTSRTRY